MIGNLEESEARAITAAATEALPSKAPLDPSQITRRRVRILPVGRTLRQYVAPNKQEANSATEVYVQVGTDVGDDWVNLALIAQLLDQPFYGELRTKQQLGYIVQSSVTSSEGVRGLVFSIQSAVLPPQEVSRAPQPASTRISTVC